MGAEPGGGAPVFLTNLRFIKRAQTYGFKASSLMAKDCGGGRHGPRLMRTCCPASAHLSRELEGPDFLSQLCELHMDAVPGRTLGVHQRFTSCAHKPGLLWGQQASQSPFPCSDNATARKNPSN